MVLKMFGNFSGEGKALVFLIQTIESTVCVYQKWKLVKKIEKQ